jgi:hypothetical protein
MDLFSKIVTYLVLLICLSGCSGKPASPRQLEVSFAAIVASKLAGGAIIRVEDVASGNYIDHDLTAPPFSVLVPDGKWNFYFVGFIGPRAWAGATHCGGALAVELGPETIEVNIKVAASTCADKPFISLISTKVSNWDQAIWDQSKWGL